MKKTREEYYDITPTEADKKDGYHYNDTSNKDTFEIT